MTDELQWFTVKVADGSGCLFQPSNSEYSYVLTAKHVIEGIDNIEIIRQYIQEGGEKVCENIKLLELPYLHNDPDKDAAIIKVEKVKGIETLLRADLNSSEKDNWYLCGHPDSRINNDFSYRRNKLRIESPVESYIEAEIEKSVVHSEIVGQSGGGIIKEEKSFFLLAGIQKKMAVEDEKESLSRIHFAPLSFFDQIIDDNNENLSILEPYYMSNFSFLEDDAFKLDIGAFDEYKIKNVRQALKNKASEIINSTLTPYGIKELFKEKLLADKNKPEELYYRNIWIAWLEFLAVMNIVKDENIDDSLLSDIFNSVRLKYSGKNVDWTYLFREDLLNSDYLGLKPNSTIVVSTNNPPIGNLVLPRAKILNNIGIVPKKGLQIDNGVKSPYDDFNFVHLEFFKKGCIVERLEKYEDIHNENELLLILKQQYNELFG